MTAPASVLTSASEWFDRQEARVGLDERDIGAGTWFCLRHAAPAFTYTGDANAVQGVMGRIFHAELLSANLTSKNAVRRRLERISPVCCTLGDERMAELWQPHLRDEVTEP